jgi:uncharacterized Zn-binding protein involved in type VI secretion
MAGRKVIVLGDLTSHGGEVISASGEGRYTIDGIPVACVGDKVSCPKKGHGPETIISGDENATLDGKAIAIEGLSKTSCGAELISKGQSRTTHDVGGSRSWKEVMGAASSAASSAALASASAGSSAGGVGAGAVSSATQTQSEAAKEEESFVEYFALLDQETSEPLTDFACVTRCDGEEQLDITEDDGLTQEAATDVEASAELLAAIQLKPVI